MVSQPLLLLEAGPSASESSPTEGRLSASCSLWGGEQRDGGRGRQPGMTGGIIRESWSSGVYQAVPATCHLHSNSEQNNWKS